MKGDNFGSLVVLLLVIAISIFLFQNYLAAKVTGFPVGTVSLTVSQSGDTYFNDLITIANASTIVVDTGLNITASISANETTAGFLNITRAMSNPTGINVPNKNAFDRFAIVTTNLSVANATLYFNYTDSEALAFIENTLGAYHFSSATNNWSLLPGGVDIEANYVFGTTIGFSTFGVFGDLKMPLPAPIFGGGHEPVSGEKPTIAKPAVPAAAFILTAQIVPPYEYIYPGGYLMSLATIDNFAFPAGIKSVKLTYRIASEKQAIDVLSETFAVETSGELARRLQIPVDLAPGTYRLIVIAEYDAAEFITQSAVPFDVVPQYIAPTARFFTYRGGQNAMAVSLLVLATALVASIIFIYSHFRKHKQTEEKIVNYVRAYINYFGRSRQK